MLAILASILAEHIIGRSFFGSLLNFFVVHDKHSHYILLVQLHLYLLFAALHQIKYLEFLGEPVEVDQVENDHLALVRLMLLLKL